MKVLLVDSDPRIRALLKQMLKTDFILDIADSAQKAEQLAYSSHYDVILLELVLPDMDGEDLCELLKARLKTVPIIIISGKATVSDKEVAFRKGADDYLVKPFSSRELKMRIKAVTRRGPSVKRLEKLQVRSLTLSMSSKIVTYKGVRILLCKKEMQLLEFLMINKGRVVSRGEILENVWDENVNPFTNTVDVHMKRLRDKIEKPFNENYVETVHGIGYLLE